LTSTTSRSPISSPTPQVAHPFGPLLVAAERNPFLEGVEPAPSPDGEKLNQHINAIALEVLKQVGGEGADVRVFHPRIQLHANEEADKQPLEELFGVDLIYLNETRRSIVMVQYKMMDPLGRKKRQISTALGTITQVDEAEWVVPIDDQLRDEMARMAQFDQPVGPVGSYRMSPSPFFFKLVRRHGSTEGGGICWAARRPEDRL
jgi:hypothetical protein